MKTLLPIAAVAMTLTFTAVSCKKDAADHLASLNPNYIDTTIAPGTDFYSHVNKGWMDAHPLTAEYARYGQFNILNDSSEHRVRSLVENLGATNPQPGTVAHKVWTIYSQAMDTARRNAEGAKPILADLKKIEDTPHEGMEDLFLWMHGNYWRRTYGGPCQFKCLRHVCIGRRHGSRRP